MTELIRLLDDVTVARIAAGEVIERPASAVKELVENSLDAGATDIRVEIQAGGRRLIRVSDNGHGIPAAQAQLAFERHTTSKIQSSSDLAHVRTLGFRGEALASIAAVSHVTAITRAAAEETGTQLRIDNGRQTNVTATGTPVGTIITVENLFNAVPARLKFLKSEATEAGRVHEIVMRYALAYPERRFVLLNNGRTVFQSPGTGELEDALIAAYGLEVARAMIAVTPSSGAPGGDRGADSGDRGADSSGARVHGFTSPPHLHRATRRHITLFLNGRWIHDQSLTFAVAQAYHTLLPKGRFPLAVLRIEVATGSVDVNVHPAKTEVRFQDSRPVWDAVQRTVRRAVTGGAAVAPMQDATRGGRTDLWPRFITPGARPVTDPWSPPASAPAPAQSELRATDGTRLPMLRVLGQVAQAFIVAEGPDGIYLIDQHAAHERVLYERFMAQAAAAPSQRLLEPQTVPLTPGEMAVLAEHGQHLNQLGFDLAAFGPDAAIVRAVPDVLATGDVGGILRAVLEATADGTDAVAESAEAQVVRAVCKQASVKAGQTLSAAEMEALLRGLEAAAAPRTCPHGRPTMIVLTVDRLAREFGRT